MTIDPLVFSRLITSTCTSPTGLHGCRGAFDVNYLLAAGRGDEGSRAGLLFGAYVGGGERFIHGFPGYAVLVPSPGLRAPPWPLPFWRAARASVLASASAGIMDAMFRLVVQRGFPEAKFDVHGNRVDRPTGHGRQKGYRQQDPCLHLNSPDRSSLFESETRRFILSQNPTGASRVVPLPAPC